MSLHPSDILRISSGYWPACALHAAVRLDLFTPLRHVTLTVTELAECLKCSVRGTDMLVTAMAAMSLLIRSGDTVALTNSARQYLCRDSAEYMGHIIKHQGHIFESWAHLDKAVQTGEPTRSSIINTNNEEERESFLLGMNNVARIQAANCVPRIDLGNRKQLLDLGGGPGTYALAFCEHNPQLKACIFDLPTSRPIAEKNIEAKGMADRVRFIGGDFACDALPSDCDVVWLSQILHGEGPASARAVVRKAVEALEHGGLCCIQEFILDDSRTGPLSSALFALNMLAGTTDGQAYTYGELREIMEEAGLGEIRPVTQNAPSPAGIICGVKL